MKEATVQNMNISKVPDTTQLGHCSTDLQYSHECTVVEYGQKQNRNHKLSFKTWLNSEHGDDVHTKIKIYIALKMLYLISQTLRKLII